MDDLREVIARAVQEAVEAMPYGNGFNTEEDMGEGEWEERPTTLREFFDDTWQSSHGDELFANASSTATDAALAAIKQAATEDRVRAALKAIDREHDELYHIKDLLAFFRAMIEAPNALAGVD